MLQLIVDGTNEKHIYNIPNILLTSITVIYSLVRCCHCFSVYR